MFFHKRYVALTVVLGHKIFHLRSIYISAIYQKSQVRNNS